MKFWPFKTKNATMKEPEWWRQTLGLENTWSGVSVTADSALQISAVYSCVRIIAETIASIPLRVYERMPDGSKRLADDHPLDSVLHGISNSEMTDYELREFMMVSLGLRGNFYGEKVLDSRGNVIAIEPLDASKIRPFRDADDSLKFHYEEQNRDYDKSELFRVPAIGSNGVIGLSPVALARESMGFSMAVEQHGAKLFKNGAQVPSVLEYPGVLDADMLERLRDSLQGQHGGSSNAFKTMILENGMSYKTVGMTAEDSQFLQTRKFNIAEIARWYRVPLHMLNELDRATFSNIEHQSIEFVRDTIRPWLVRIEKAALRDLFPAQQRGRYFIEHNVDALLRGDQKSRYEAYGKAITDGWMNRNEVRKLENRDAVEGLDEYLVPLNMSRADEIEDSVMQDLVSQEIRAVMAEGGRKQGDDFNNWVVSFYERHIPKAEKLLVLESGALTDYALMRVKQLKEHGANIASTWVKDELKAQL